MGGDDAHRAGCGKSPGGRSAPCASGSRGFCAKVHIQFTPLGAPPSAQGHGYEENVRRAISSAPYSRVSATRRRSQGLRSQVGTCGSRWPRSVAFSSATFLVAVASARRHCDFRPVAQMEVALRRLNSSCKTYSSFCIQSRQCGCSPLQDESVWATSQPERECLNTRPWNRPDKKAQGVFA